MLLNSLRAHGLAGTIAIIFKSKLNSTKHFRAQVAGRRGLEIGGPSAFFRTFLPIYDCICSLDNVVFGNNTIWEGAVTEAFLYHPTQLHGRNYIAEGTDLRPHFTDATYDFVLSCHNLEHIANPIKALKEWIRVVKPGGSIILILPNHSRTFDHRRLPTSVDHLLADYHADMQEDDLTHVEEILTKHDLRRDPSTGNWEIFRKRAFNNLQFRSLHHHVFNTENSRKLLETVGLQIKIIETALPHHIAILACK